MEKELLEKIEKHLQSIDIQLEDLRQSIVSVDYTKALKDIKSLLENIKNKQR